MPSSVSHPLSCCGPRALEKYKLQKRLIAWQTSRRCYWTLHDCDPFTDALQLPVPFPTRFLNHPSEHHRKTLSHFIHSLHSMTHMGKQERFLLLTCSMAGFIQINSGLSILIPNLLDFIHQRERIPAFHLSLL